MTFLPGAPPRSEPTAAYAAVAAQPTEGGIRTKQHSPLIPPTTPCQPSHTHHYEKARIRSRLNHTRHRRGGVASSASLRHSGTGWSVRYPRAARLRSPTTEWEEDCCVSTTHSVSLSFALCIWHMIVHLISRSPRGLSGRPEVLKRGGRGGLERVGDKSHSGRNLFGRETRPQFGW